MFDMNVLQFSSKVRSGSGQWLAEAVATAGLILVVLRAPAAKAPALVACYIGAAYWFTASTSFANPAAVLGRMLSDSFAGIAPASAAWLCAGPGRGALAGVVLHRALGVRQRPAKAKAGGILATLAAVTPTTSRTATIVQLGIAQTLAWASSYYLPAILAVPMARDLGVSTPTVFAAFSAALVVSALLGPAAGKAIDRHGGKPVLAANSVIFAAGLVVLALAQGPWACLPAG
jgi:hypothetical protein